MKEVKHILALIYRFLIREEKDKEKQEIMNWYENYQIDYTPSKEHIKLTGESVKQRVFHSIQEEQSKKNRAYWWRPVIAAASIIFVAGISFWVFTRDSIQIPDSHFLSSITPSDPKAKITLESGQIIDLEKMAIDSCLRFEDIEIRKDSTGQITYVQNDTGGRSSKSSTIETPNNANYTLNLSDGTVVILNAGTKLKYPNSFNTGDRVVELDGEAYFIVQKTTSKQKFLVKTRQQITEVLGTTFNIKARNYQASEQISLEEGLIRVVNTRNTAVQIVQPGQQMEISPTTTKIKTVDLEPYLAWTKGYFYLDGQNTAEVLQEIANWYDIEINYNQSKKQNNYKGKIPKNLPLNKLIDLLTFTELKAEPILQQDRLKLIIK